MTDASNLLAPLLAALDPRLVLLADGARRTRAGAGVASWCSENGREAEDVPGDPDDWPEHGDLLVLSSTSLPDVADPLGRRLVAADGERGRVAAIAHAEPGPVAALDRPDLETVTLPVLGGVTLAAHVGVVAELGSAWPAFDPAGPVADLLAALERQRDEVAARLGVLRREFDELETRRQTDARAIARLDRELTHLRRDAREAAVLRRQVDALQRDYARLRGRRSVRAVLGMAEYARPLFQLRRGQVDLRLPGRRAREAATEARVRRTHHEFRSTDVGTFYELARRVVAANEGRASFIDRWATSEEALREGRGYRATEDSPMVSVVMPTHNRADLIREAISTVTDQTYVKWELLVCDDASTDDTEEVVSSFGDDRIRYLKLPRGGAAAARNAGLAEAEGDLVAYLDSDNLWHPRFLETHVRALEEHPGRHVSYASYVDVIIDGDDLTVKKADRLPFDYERLSRRNFVDLNSMVHRRALYDHLGGFNEDLVRQQDWDLILKYTFLADPVYVDLLLALYRRNRDWGQITDTHAQDRRPRAIIEESVARYHREGLPREATAPEQRRLTVLSWDVCRNHFSKAYNVAEAMEHPERVELVGFRFFDEPVFAPYATADPAFAMHVLEGGEFPDWSAEMARAVSRVSGDVVYAVKPRLPSLGVALLANHAFGTPLVLETNDLESVVERPTAGQEAASVQLSDVDPADLRLLEPTGMLWTAIMEGLAHRLPWRATHNANLDEHFGGGAFQMRNPKDDARFDPDRYDRDEVREQLGYGPDDRVLLFGGMVRRHKGIFRYAELLEKAGPQYRLLVVGSRETPDQRELRDEVGDRVQILDPQDRNEMARINVACDAVVLWLDPEVPASHYQMPFKLTDALAMRVPVLANDIGDLGHLGREGYLRLVPFGDDQALVDALAELDTDPLATREMVEAGRRLYLRQFSYHATRRQMELLMDRVAPTRGTLPVAREFAEFFAAFRRAQMPYRTVEPGGAE